MLAYGLGLLIFLLMLIVLVSSPIHAFLPIIEISLIIIAFYPIIVSVLLGFLEALCLLGLLLMAVFGFDLLVALLEGAPIF